MREALAGLVVACAAVAALAGSPAAAVSTAYADAQKLPADARQYARYLSVYAIPEGQRADFVKTLTFHVNSLSREGDFALPANVGGDVYRIDLRDFGWDRAVWDKLPDPYFLDLQHPVEGGYKEVEQEYGHFEEATVKGGWPQPKRWVTTRKVKEKIKADAPAYFPMGAWCGKDAAALVELTGSYVPIVRADWFFAQTAQQVNRFGAGYYDFLGLKSRADAEDLCGLDRAKARKLAREIAAIVQDSGVALNNRQLLRFQAITGGYWTSLDCNKSTGANNALRLLDGDFQHDAEEIYFVLPNGLFGLVASDAKGVLQDTVPDKIASDKASTSNDARVHPGLSCIRCHTNGLKPVNDWARAFYSGGTQLQSPDYDALKRLKQLYLSDLDTKLTRDVEDYASACKKLNGRTPQDQASAYADAWRAYSETPVTGEQFARELGCSRLEMIRAFDGYARGNAGIDPVLGGYLKTAEMPARREQVEEIFGTAATILCGGKK